jgi:hypothetical protein
MRRFTVILLCALAVVPAALAGGQATGDGVLELKAAYGYVKIGTDLQPARGILWGQMDRGKLVVVDPVAGDQQTIFVSGWDRKSDTILTDSGATVTTYYGTDIHFRVTGGKYKLTFNGQGIDLTAVGAGVAYLNGDENAVDAGYYAVDSGKWQPMPLYTLKPQAVFFPAQTAPTP